MKGHERERELVKGTMPARRIAGRRVAYIQSGIRCVQTASAATGARSGFMLGSLPTDGAVGLDDRQSDRSFRFARLSVSGVTRFDASGGPACWWLARDSPWVRD